MIVVEKLGSQMELKTPYMSDLLFSFKDGGHCVGRW